MRLFVVPLCLIAASFSRVCDRDDGVSGSASAAASASVSGSAQVAATLAAPRIGGSVVSIGDFSVELLLRQAGRVEALVSDASGKLVSEGVSLELTAKTKGGASERVELAFAPARARFQGRAKAGVELSPGDVDLKLNVGGKAQSAKTAVAVVAPDPALGGSVLVAGAFSAELFAKPNGEVLAFVKDAAGADVHADAGAKLKAYATAKGGAREEIALAFDGPRACFTGKAKAGVELSPGPIELAVDAKAGAGIGRLESIALSVDASHGGQIVVAGDYSVELVADGAALSAFVFDASGEAHTAGDLGLKLDLGADAATALALAWDAPNLSYKGKLDANLDLSMQPIRITLTAAGKAFVGAVASLKAASRLQTGAKLDATASADADAKLDANAKLGANAKLAAGAKANLDPKLEANAKAATSKAANASASLAVTPPKVDVNAKTSAGANAKAGAGAKAGASFSFGTK